MVLRQRLGRGYEREFQGVPPVFLRGAFPRIPRKATATRFRLTPVTERPHHFQSSLLHIHVLSTSAQSFNSGCAYHDTHETNFGIGVGFAYSTLNM